MKPEAEIRRHRDNLRLMIVQPCACRGTGHQPQCAFGHALMQHSIDVLSWTLGECNEMESLVEHFEHESADKQRWPGIG